MKVDGQVLGTPASMAPEQPVATHINHPVPAATASDGIVPRTGSDHVPTAAGKHDIVTAASVDH